MLIKQEKRNRRHKRVRSKIKGTADIPRLCLFKSNNHIYAQLINDDKGSVLIAVSDLTVGLKNKGEKSVKKSKAKEGEGKGEGGDEKKMTKGVSLAYEMGEIMAGKAKEIKIKKIVFDRGGYKYHGRVKALAEGARKGGLEF